MITLNHCWTLLNFHSSGGTVQTIPKNLDRTTDTMNQGTRGGDNTHSLIWYICAFFFFVRCQTAAGHFTPTASAGTVLTKDLIVSMTQVLPLDRKIYLIIQRSAHRCAWRLSLCVCVSRHKSTQAVFKEVVLRGPLTQQYCLRSFWRCSKLLSHWARTRGKGVLLKTLMQPAAAAAVVVFVVGFFVPPHHMYLLMASNSSTFVPAVWLLINQWP